MTDLALTPDTYCPPKNTEGVYEDKLPYGTRDQTYICPCSASNRSYRRTTLKTHFKSQTHQRWLERMNENQDNHLQQLLKLIQETAATERSQKLIIADLQKQLDVAKAKQAGQEHLIRVRDAKIQHLETELYALQPLAADVQEGVGVLVGDSQ